MLRAEQRIAEITALYRNKILNFWAGREREFVVEMVRALDEAAFAFTMAPNRAELRKYDVDRHEMIRGAALALRPFLEKIRDQTGEIPWKRSTAEIRAQADQYLMDCGVLAAQQRLAALERNGLVQASFVTDDHLILKVASDAVEAAELEAAVWLRDTVRQRLAPLEQKLASMKAEIACRIDEYVSVDDGWFVNYKTDDELFQYHKEYAAILANGIAEAEALPARSVLGGRSFEIWTSSSIEAYGRVAQHIAFATRLKATTSGLELRDLLTRIARKDEIVADWQKAHEPDTWPKQIIAGLTLDASSAAVCERDYDTPLPYYIDLGRDHVLLPVFGGLMNAHAGLVWHLRREYRSDWDRSVDGRESIFRDDLRKALPSRRYSVPDRGFRLRRPNHTELTDVDAVIVDEKTGDLALVQLKWPDLYGHSLAERNSRRLNLLKANEWVERVSQWVDDRSSGEVAAAFGLKSNGRQSPLLIVMARHVAQFSGETGYNIKARWISWPRFAHICKKYRYGNIFRIIDRQGGERAESAPRTSTRIYKIADLTVEIRTV